MNSTRLLHSVNRALGGVGGGKRRGPGRAAKPYFIGDYVEFLLHWKVNAGHPINPPIEMWYVDSFKKNPERVKVKMLRGSCDYYSTRGDYAELVDGRTVATSYLFPVGSGYAKPIYAWIDDRMGGVHNWVAIPRGWQKKPEMLAQQYGITLGK